MFIVLNGPLGIGKSTLAEALCERITGCAMLSGDALLALNPEPPDPVASLHATVTLLVAHHHRHGYRHFVIEHIWRSAADLEDLCARLTTVDPRAACRCFLLTLPAPENVRRIARRQPARENDDPEMELHVSAVERAALAGARGVGEPFDVSAPVPELVERLVVMLGLSSPLPQGARQRSP